jgi:sugar/nucleoside kinase (ribokinase family)
MDSTICVVGDAFIDLTVPIDKIVPDGARPGNISLSYGGTANIAVWLSRQGVKSSFLGKVGNDPLGISFKNNLTKEKVDDITVLDHKFQTGICISLVKKDGSRTMITSRGANDNLNLVDIEKNLKKIINSPELFFFSGYSLISSTTSKAIEYLLKKSKENEKEIWFNPGAHNLISEKYIRIIKKYCDGIILNLDEGRTLCSEDEVEDVSKSLKSWVDTVILTLSAKGCVAINDYEYLYIPAKKVERVLDSTGAGDAFTAGFLTGKVKGESIKNCCKLGHEVAATVIQRYGAR